MSKRKEIAINIDRLEITFTATEEVKCFYRNIKDKHTLDNGLWIKRTASVKFHHEFAIWLEDWNEKRGLHPHLIAYLYFDSPNPNRNNVYVSFTNDTLYGDIVSGRHYLGEVLGLSFKCISKLDIAVDFNFNIQSRILKAYKNLDYDLIVNGVIADDSKVKNVGASTGNNPRLRPFQKHEFYISNKDKTLTFKCYDKRKEIEDEGRKEYVAESNNFVGNSIWRIEMTCKNYKMLAKSLQKLGISDEDLFSGLESDDMLVALFNHLMNRVIKLRKGRKSYNLLTVALKDVEYR